MDTDSLLQFWHEHLNTIIGVLIAVCFVLIAVYLFLEFWKEKNAEEAEKGQVDLGPIEESLKKLLEGAQIPKAATGSGSEAVDSQELQKLQALVSEKDELIQKLEESQQGGSGESVDTSELEEKIKDLEARLMEYEIIEDDIADLSMYKEENVRLKDELDKLKGGAPVSAAPPAPEPAVESEKPAESDVAKEVAEMTADNPDDEVDLGDDIMAEFAAAVQEQKNGPPPVDKAEVDASAQESPEESVATASAEGGSPGSGNEESNDDALVSAAMEQLESMDEGQPVGESVPQKEEVSDPMDLMADIDVDAIGESPAEATENESVDDLVAAEVAGEVTSEAVAEEIVEKVGQEAEADFDVLAPDTDKMLGEIEALNASAADDDGSDALGEAVDTDKMLTEMDDLNMSVGGSAAQEEKEQKQLASEFDNFVKES